MVAFCVSSYSKCGHLLDYIQTVFKPGVSSVFELLFRNKNGREMLVHKDNCVIMQLMWTVGRKDDISTQLKEMT